MNEKKIGVLGRLSLLMCTLVWGSSFVVLKNTLDVLPPFTLLAVRFAGGGVVMALLCAREWKKLDRNYLLGGALMGICLFAAFGTQTYGLTFTTPGINAFLTATYSVIVPFLAWLVYKKRPDGYNLAAAAIALAGVGLVSVNEQLRIGPGELLTLICGFFYAWHILATDRFVRGRSVMLLTSIQFLSAAVLCAGAAALTETPPAAFPTEAVGSLAYLCLGCTALCYFCQAFGQKHTPPAASAVILTLESVFGALFSALFYHETVTLRLLSGFALIFIAVLVSEVKPSFGLRRRAPERSGGG